jgi:hypothetical protein
VRSPRKIGASTARKTGERLRRVTVLPRESVFDDSE